jgi:hypothetical protein
MSLIKSSLENQPYYNLESIFRAFKRKEIKASHRLTENDIITRGVTQHPAGGSARELRKSD